MRILVTGGAGFIGSHLCERLLKEGNDVICLDNLFTGSKDNIRHLLKNSHFEFIRHDVTQPILLEVEQIYNLACPASPVQYQSNPIKTVKTGVLGVLNMLGLAKRVKARILQASTSEVYGDPAIHPQTELYWGNVNCLGKRACYDESKRIGETLMTNYHIQNKVDIRIARIFNTYGPNMAVDDGRVVSNFIVQALQGKDITIYGDGSQTRSFCYVSDLVDGLIKLMNNTTLNVPINIGNPGEYSMIELANRVKLLTKSKSKIVFNELPEDDPMQRCPEISMAKKYLKWEPKINLDRGLIQTIAYFMKKLKEAK